MGAQVIDRKGRFFTVGDGKGSMPPSEMEIDHCYTSGSTAGSHYAARLLQRAAAGSSIKVLLAAAVAATNSEFDRKVLNNFK